MVELNLDLPCYDVVRLGDELAKGDRIQIIVGNRQYADYTFGVTKEREIPQPRKEYPYLRKWRVRLSFISLHYTQNNIVLLNIAQRNVIWNV